MTRQTAAEPTPDRMADAVEKIANAESAARARNEATVAVSTDDLHLVMRMVSTLVKRAHRLGVPLFD